MGQQGGGGAEPVRGEEWDAGAQDRVRLEKPVGRTITLEAEHNSARPEAAIESDSCLTKSMRSSIPRRYSSRPGSSPTRLHARWKTSSASPMAAKPASLSSTAPSSIA